MPLLHLQKTSKKMNILKNKYVLLCFIITIGSKLHAQYEPKDGVKLNYNQIYFEFPTTAHLVNYKLIVAYDSTQDKLNFNQYTVGVYQTKQNKQLPKWRLQNK